MKYDKSNEENEFYDELYKSEYVLNIRKYSKKNLILAIILVLLIPSLVIPGYYYNLEFIYIIAGIIFFVSMIYLLINDMLCKKITEDGINYYIKNFFEKRYVAKDVSTEEIEDYYSKNPNIIAKVLNIEEYGGSFTTLKYLEEEILDSHIIRFNKNNQDIDLFKHEGYDSTGRSVVKRITYFLVTDTIENKVMCLNIKDAWRKNNEFEKTFCDYENDIDKIFKRMKNEKMGQYLVLTEKQRKELVDIRNKYYNINFSIIINEGKLIIKSSIGIYLDYNMDCFKKIYYMGNCLDEILDVFMNM